MRFPALTEDGIRFAEANPDSIVVRLAVAAEEHYAVGWPKDHLRAAIRAVNAAGERQRLRELVERSRQ